MNILYIAYSCSPIYGSEDSVGWNIPLASSESNNVFVITKIESRNSIDEYLKEHGNVSVRFFYVDIPRMYKKFFRGFLYSGLLNIFHREALSIARDICKEYGIDIIHQITPVEFRAIGNYWKIPNVKFVCGPLGGAEYAPNGLWTYTKGHRAVETLRKWVNGWHRWKYNLTGCLRKCDCLIYANAETKEYLGMEGPIITEVAVGRLREQLPIKDNHGQCVFLVAGRMIYRKGHRFLLDAVRRIHSDKDYIVRILGVGEELPLLKKIVDADEGLRKRIVFVGKIPYREMEKEYDKADVFILPSLRETTGSVLLEAIGNGLPVIAINKFGSGLIVNDDIGWTYKGNSQEEYLDSLANVMEYCIDHPEEVRRKAMNALTESAKYTWERKVGQFSEIYQRVLTK